MRRFRAPSIALFAVLQRSPAIRIAASFGENFPGFPAGALVRAAAVSAVALGAVDSVAGASSTGLPASSFTYTLVTGNPGHPSPNTTASGSQITPVAFSLTSVPVQAAPQSWAIEGPMPPGLSFGISGNAVTGLAAGVVGEVNLANPTLFGTPTQAGDYKFLMQAYQLPNGQGYFSTIFTYEVVVTGANAAPAFTKEPISQSILTGGSATFSVVTSGYPAPTYQWDFNGSPIAGATSSTLTISNATAADAGNYTCVATNSTGSVTTNTVALAVSAVSSAPAFTAQPLGQTIASGGTVVFNVAASGNPSPSFQWDLNGTPILGATDPTLVVRASTAANAGNYTCVVTNSLGTATSNVANLAISTTPDQGRLINISCRAAVGTGGNILIVGFVSGGPETSGTQPLLIRGAGPALIPFGVSGTLADPQLALYQGSNLVESNTGWNGSVQITAEDAAVGAFPLTNPASKDSALFIPNLSPSSYTAQIAGASGDTGVALAEVYDATPAGAFTPASPHIVNISARVQVGTGGNILIAGFVIGGSTSKTVLVRASGPALVPFGVAGTLPDPQLVLYSGLTIVASNGGWTGNPAIAASAASVGAFPWSDALSKDSALLVTLPPGSYTVQVSGAAGTPGDTGVALVEVYDVP